MADIKPVREGKKRQWCKCTKCVGLSYYDYRPYSLSNPVMGALPCGHQFEDADRISADRAAEIALAQIA